MFGEIEKIIKERKLTLADCDYHTLRTLENGGKLRALVLKGEKIAHVEFICPKCGNYEYKTIEWKPVSKAAIYRFSVTCSKCGYVIKVEKLKKAKK
jgi:ribosomal protein S27AE